MSLRQKLTRPLVVEPAHEHTHTVVFLHRFPAETTDSELRSKVLSDKMTKNHKTLREQFPAVRWVFPHPKAHARHWSNLSPEDKTELGLATRLPYITQVVLQEAARAGGLDRIVLGGQGETAEAAHEAMSSFPEVTEAILDQPGKVAALIQEHFHPDWTEISQLRLAGFVGMHAQDGGLTRDVCGYGIMSKTDGPIRVNSTIVTNTPHRFIKGGYKVQTTTWDGRRIDDFAEFLVSVGVHRVRYEIPGSNQGKEILTPKHRIPERTTCRADGRDELNDKQKYALEVVKQKAAADRERERILIRIEADKVERKIRQERQRQARIYRSQAQQGLPNLRGGALAPAAPADAISSDDFEPGLGNEAWE